MARRERAVRLEVRIADWMAGAARHTISERTRRQQFEPQDSSVD